MTQERERLPTKAQIGAVTDLSVLDGWRDDIARAVAKMETDLEFLAGDNPEWAARARAALAIHRLTDRIIARRMGALRRSAMTTAKTARRPEADCDPLTLEVLRARPAVDLDALTTTDQVDERMSWLVARIDAVTADREDEIGMEAADRDEGFLAATGNALRHMRALRQDLQTRRGRLNKAEKAAARAAEVPHQETRERLFIDAARELLDRATYLRLWDEVDRREELQSAKAAA